MFVMFLGVALRVGFSRGSGLNLERIGKNFSFWFKDGLFYGKEIF